MFWLSRPLLPAGLAVEVPAIAIESPVSPLSPMDPSVALGLTRDQLGAAACALSAGSVALILVESGATWVQIFAGGSAVALLPAAGSPAGALVLFCWLLLARLRRQPARWRAASAGVMIAGAALVDPGALLLLPVAWFHLRDAYPRGGRLEPAVLTYGFALGGWVLLSMAALWVRRSLDGVGTRFARLARVDPGSAADRLWEAWFPVGHVRALSEGRLDLAGALALVAVMAALFALGLGLSALVRGRRAVLPPRRATAAAAAAVGLLFGVYAAIAPARMPPSWAPAMGALIWAWSIGTGAMPTATRRWALPLLPVAIGAAQAAMLLR